VSRTAKTTAKATYELSRLGTVASVAEALAYSPSSVSVQLAQLEREAGIKLLRRVGRNVELTPAGRRLAAYAEQALAADEAIRTELAGLGDAPRGGLASAPGCEERVDRDLGVGEVPVVDGDALADESADRLVDVPYVDVHACDDSIAADPECGELAAPGVAAERDAIPFAG
jgi:DNA-binding transcriptional ArsR family regulator